jgi:hypothetical protein
MREPRGERYLRAELACFSCSHVAGQVIGPVDAPLARARFRPAGTPEGTWLRFVPGQPLRCPRCAGRLRLEPIEYARLEPGAVMPWRLPSPADDRASVPGPANPRGDAA